MKALPVSIENRAVTLALRPPRVALLFRGGEQWHDWARLAISAASRVWGGAGFALVPFGPDGTVHPKVLELVTRYDPDYVAITTHSIADWIRVAPDLLDAPAAASLESSSAEDVEDPAAHNAAKRVLKECNPLTLSVAGDVAHWHELSSSRPTQDPFIAVPGPESRPAACIAASSRWTGDLALWACARTGLPTADTDRTQPDDGELLRWLIALADPIDELLWFAGLATGDTVAGKPTWFQAASSDLAMIHTGHARDSAVVVVGDTVDDFALAVLLDRMLGFGLWLTEDTLLRHFDGGWRPQSALDARLRLSFAPDIPVTSVSIPPEQLPTILTRLAGRGHTVTINGTSVSSPSGPTYAVREPVVSRGGLATLMMEEHLGASLAAAVTHAEDDTLGLESEIASLIPTNPRLSASGNPAWLLDISISGNPMPPSRRLRSTALGRPVEPIMIRSARDGLAMHAGSFGLVVSGTVLASRLARTKPRFLGMRSWVVAQAERHDLRVRTSRPGVNADLLSRRLGSRQRLREVVSGPLLPALRDLSLLRTSAKKGRTTDAFPEGDGVLLGSTRLLMMKGVARLTPEMNPAERRAAIDELLRTRLMRQGLVLDCEECDTPSFVGIDDLGQTYSCSRCGADNEFTAARWREPIDEPTWFYDLHPTLRELISRHGDVPLLTAQHLQAESRRYFDTSELEFYRDETLKPDFEIDLISFSDDGVSVIEAKSNGSLGAGKDFQDTVQKRFRAAEAIDADRVVFSRSGDAWSPDTVQRVTKIQQSQYPGVDLAWIEKLR